MRENQSFIKRTNAFSLIELLLVIAIIALIGAILLSALYQAKGRAVRLQCANNLRELGAALQDFKLDHNFYPAQVDPGDETEDRNWMDALGNEINLNKNVQYVAHGVWHCPAATRPTSADWVQHHEWGYEEYAYNAFGFGPWQFTNSLGLSEYWSLNGVIHAVTRVREPQVANPAGMYAIGDGLVGGPDFVRDGMGIFGRVNDRTSNAPGYSAVDLAASTKRSYARHQGFANVAFADGHVASLTLKLLFVATNDTALSAWNRDNLPHRERLAP